MFLHLINCIALTATFRRKQSLPRDQNKNLILGYNLLNLALESKVFLLNYLLAFLLVGSKAPRRLGAHFFSRKSVHWSELRSDILLIAGEQEFDIMLIQTITNEYVARGRNNEVLFAWKWKLIILYDYRVFYFQDQRNDQIIRTIDIKAQN